MTFRNVILHTVLVDPVKFSLLSLCFLDTMHRLTGMDTGSEYRVPLRSFMESRLALVFDHQILVLCMSWFHGKIFFFLGVAVGCFFFLKMR